MNKEEEDPIFSFIRRLDLNTNELDTGEKIDYKRAAQLLGVDNKSRQLDLLAKRYLFWIWLRENTFLTLHGIGSITGHDHSTVFTGMKQAKGVSGIWAKRYQFEVDQVTKLIKR